MGREEHLEHDARYDRADEFMEVVMGHWDSWDDDALIIDKKSGRFADPKKVRRLDHRGKFFKSRGPFTVPRSPQGHPVIIQAGASGRGKRFAGRWGEVIFASAHTTEFAQQAYKAFKDEAASMGRDPDKMFICLGVMCVAGATKSEAEDKMAMIEKLPLEIDALSLLAEGLNFDFATKGMDEPMTDAELGSLTGMLTIRDHVIKISGKPNPTVRDFLKYNNRGQTHGSIVGGPKEIADYLENMFVNRGCDGFVVAATHVPGSYADFVKHVVPELQKRGLYHKDYAGKTLRENLGSADAENRRLEAIGKYTCAGCVIRLAASRHSASSRVTASPKPGAICSTRGRRPGRFTRSKDVKVELPVWPRTFYCAGMNYVKHLTEAANARGEVPDVPQRAEIGYRAQSALIAHDEDVVIPASATEKIHYEGELAVVIGRKAKHLSERDALSCVFGYTIGNDVSERTWQRADRGLWRSKNADTFKPMGPWIETEADLDKMETKVRAQRRRDAPSFTPTICCSACRNSLPK